MDSVEILFLVLELVTLTVIFAYAKTFRDKLHYLNRSLLAVESGLHSLIRDLTAGVTHNMHATKEELSVSISNTETTLSKRLSHIVPDLEEFVQTQRLGYINPSCHYDYLVPTTLLLQVMDRNRMSAISQEREYLATLKRDILDNGLREPLIVAYDDRGQLFLREGHHRLRVLEEVPLLPVVLKKVPKCGGGFNAAAIEILFKAFAKDNYVPPR